jgi:signal transduction histidine kinase
VSPFTSAGRAVARALSRLSAGFDWLPIRVRLAGVSALLTLVILCVFAIAAGSLTVHRIRSDFDRDVEVTAIQLPSVLNIQAGINGEHGVLRITPELGAFATKADHSVIRVFALGGGLLTGAPAGAPSLGAPNPIAHTVAGYRVVSRLAVVRELGTDEPYGRVWIEYARAVSGTESTVARVELFLLIGVLAGTGFALLAGMAIARRAMGPIAELTKTAAAITRTRDPSQRMPQFKADDEVAELARTLEGMLRELDAARAESESMLTRQRRFVADASHELRTPLTSVLANLELLADSLRGEEGDAARSALRSSQRMRRLVADLLLLARSDVGRTVSPEPCDLAEIVVEATGELGPVSGEHAIIVDAHPAVVEGLRDELHRLVINLLENALRHTPPGTEIRIGTAQVGDEAVMSVEDDGPGVAPELTGTLFERFVRGAGDRGGSFGLGLAIVRAVATSHGGSVALEPARQGTGARFVVRLPLASDLDDDGEDHRPPLETVVDQLR